MFDKITLLDKKGKAFIKNEKGLCLNARFYCSANHYSFP